MKWLSQLMNRVTHCIVIWALNIRSITYGSTSPQPQQSRDYNFQEDAYIYEL